MTVRLNLSAPFSPLLAQLADRAGMMVSPKAAQAAGDKFGANPVCSGPFKFVERVAQDRIVLERYPGYWNKGQIFLDKIIYLPIVDSTVRLANLKSGQLDFIERMAPSDVPALKTDSRFKISKITEIGYQGITMNVGKSDLAKTNPIGKDPRVREAFELALDRDGIVQVVMEGEATVGNQWVAPDNPFYAKNVPIPKRDVARAKALLQEAGMPNPTVTLMTPTTSDAQKIAQVVQAMVKEAGFDVKIQSTEFATSLDLADKGQYDAYVLAWSGRADPDGNIYSFDACKQPLNYAGYCKQEVDDLLNQSRTAGDLAERKKAYDQIAAIVLKDRPIVYLLPPALAVGVHDEAVRPAHDSRRAGAGAGPEVQLRRQPDADVHVPDPAPRDDRPDAVVRHDADLRAAAAAARRSGGRARRRGPRSRASSPTCTRSCTSTSRCRCATCTGWAACCTATSASRCACRSR